MDNILFDNFKYQNSILMHEHIFNIYPPSKKRVNTEFTLELLNQLDAYKVKYIVDLTPYTNVDRYLDIVDASPLPIICCIGFLYGKYLTTRDKRISEDEIYTQMRQQYTIGLGKRKIQPCLIKIATNTNEIKDYERHFFSAAIKLSNEYDIPIAFHCPFNTFFNYIELLRIGINPTLLMICHYENQYKRVASQEFERQAKRIASNGAYIQLSDFGTKPNSPKSKSILSLFRYLTMSGYSSQLLLSSDCSWTWINGQPKLKSGNMNLGYKYLFEYTIPLLAENGIDQQVIANVLAKNSRLFLRIGEEE